MIVLDGGTKIINSFADLSSFRYSADIVLTVSKSLQGTMCTERNIIFYQSIRMCNFGMFYSTS